MKTCTTCKQEKPEYEFHKRSRSGLQHNCKACAVVLTQQWRKNNPSKVRQATRRTKAQTKYGLTLSELHEELNKQDFRCKICQKIINFNASDKCDKPHVDHDHASGKFRGLLCLTCNTGLGMFGDSPELLETALEYLNSFRQSERLSELAPKGDAIVRSHGNQNHERLAEMTNPILLDE